MFKKPKRITSERSALALSVKEITIPLCDYTDLIAKETMLEQVAYVIAKDGSEFGTMATLRAILQMDTSEREK